MAVGVVLAVLVRPVPEQHWIDAGRLGVGSEAAAVADVAFSPDGSLLATAGADHAIRLWDGRTLEPVVTLEGHSGGVRSVAFSADGKTLVSGSDDDTVKVWNVETRKAVGTLNHTTNAFYHRSYGKVALSPDGRWMAAAYSAYNETGMDLWDVPQQRFVAAVPQISKPVRAMAFTGDGELVVALPDDDALRLYGVPGWTRLAELPGAGNPYSAAVSRDGRTLATGGATGEARLWSLGTRTSTRTLTATGEPAAAAGVALSPDLKLVATGGLDDKVRIWSAADGRLVATLPGDGDVNNVAFSADGRTLVAATDKGGAHVWRLTRT
ncbi:WD40 repeat domain-containing protein [Dactylosporangium sp. CS-047395]|uniref:WD40 repeat domain-containing protein n=1 Tax=Dactylosporangium sp. CS-047395 TaxID=3239936 RepID=UPI003D8B2441